MEPIAVDVTDSADLEALADEVSRTGGERLLCRDGRVLARVVPPGLPTAAETDTGLPPWNPTEEDWVASRAAAGIWAGRGLDGLVEEIHAARKRGDRPDSRPPRHS